MNQQLGKSIWVALIATLCAVGVHSYLTMHHYQLILGVAEGHGFCNIGPKMDCDAVNTSAYSELFGFPIALWGAATNAFLAILILWRVVFDNRRAERLALYLSAFVVGISLVMGSISYLKIGLICLFCSAAYLLSFISFGALIAHNSVSAFKNLGGDLAALFKKSEGLSFLVTGLVVVPLAVFIVNDMVMKSYGVELKWVVRDSIEAWQNAKQHTFEDLGGLTMGPPVEKAVMTIVEFADFRCPHCKHAVPTIHSFVKSHPDVHFTFMNFPLDSNCNPAMDRPGESCPLAKSAYCAGKMGKGWETHDWLYDHQGTFSSSDLSSMIKDVKLDETQLKTCMDAPETHDAIMKQAAKGKDSDVEGTPSIFVNGKFLPAGFLIPVLQAAYNEIKK